MGLLSLLTAGTSPSSMISEGLKFVDKLNYSPEEKAKMHKDLITEANKVYIEGLKDNNTSRSLTRRWIAIPITYMYLLAVFAVMILAILQMPTTVIEPITEVIKTMTVPFSVVLGFYFGGHIVGGLKNGK